MTKRYDPEKVTHPFDVTESALIIGSVAAVVGLAGGSFYGTLRTKTPTLFALVSSGQCFAIGTTFCLARTAILNKDGLQNYWRHTRGLPLIPRNDIPPSPSDRIRASAIAGAFTGFSLGFVFRGPANVIPGTIMFTLFGWAGQHGYHYLDQRNSQKLMHQAQLKALAKDKSQETPPEEETLFEKFAKSKWSPMTILTDEQYEGMLQEKLLKFEADIAIIDERIGAFKKMAAEEEAKRALKKQEEGSKEKK